MRPVTAQADRLPPRLPSLALIRTTTGAESWSFIYCFFANHLPFLAPNRSEPCPSHERIANAVGPLASLGPDRRSITGFLAPQPG